MIITIKSKGNKMKKIYLALVIALALAGGAVQNNAKAENLKCSKSVVYNLNHTEIIEIDGVKYLVTYNDKNDIIQIDPMD